MSDARPVGVVRADWERWRKSPADARVDYTELGWTLIHDVPGLLERLDQPCGSCHPCENWSDETWRRAGRKPPTVHEWDEARAELTQLRAVLAAPFAARLGVSGTREDNGG